MDFGPARNKTYCDFRFELPVATGGMGLFGVFSVENVSIFALFSILLKSSFKSGSTSGPLPVVVFERVNFKYLSNLNGVP